jgi:alpha-tubulin suppressor-like RCC1 family protein
LALKRDGTVIAWGNNDAGQCDGPKESGITFIAANGWYSAAVRANGTIIHWPLQWSQSNQIPFKSVNVGINLGLGFSVGLTEDGTAVTDGYWEILPGYVPPQSKVSDITSASTNAEGNVLLLKKDGTVIAWGPNDYGQCTIPSGLSDVNYIYAGSGFALALKKAPRQP